MALFWLPYSYCWLGLRSKETTDENRALLFIFYYTVTYHMSTAKFSNDALPVNPLEEEQTKNPPKAGSQRPEPATAGSAHS